MNHAIRITLPYEDCKHIIQEWSDRCHAAVVYQHEADEEISKTHVHIALYGCEVKSEQLKRMWKEAPGKGNEFWSWKPCDPIILSDTQTEGVKYLTYMSKGVLRAKFVKNISDIQLENARSSWVEPVKADKSGESSERIIQKVLAKIKIVNKSRYYRDEDEIELGQCKYNLELLMDIVRTESFKMLWGERRMAPHASHYKIIATTVFLRLCEDFQCFDEGIGRMKNLWY